MTLNKFNRWIFNVTATTDSITQRYAWKIRYAAHVIRQGGVIAHPTEAVWGLACDPFNPQAIATILSLKKRPVSKGLILISGVSEHFEPLLRPLSRELQKRFYTPQNNPTTWLVPDIENQVPKSVKGQHDTVAIRVVDHSELTDLTRVLGHPIVSSSANPAGKEPARSKLRVYQYFSTHLDYILPAQLGGFSRPSIIRDLQTANTIRC
ncbi:MAG: L-threonylcarbamoyladenylate synthase [Oleiphilaceae bacterium]|jgi:L-threonylcarbamoyladenylate synthase